MIIIDSAVLACGAEPEKAETAAKFFNGLAHVGCTTLTIAHETKSENHKYPFGSVFFWNSARNIWNAQHETDGENSIQLGLFHRKANHGKKHSLVSIRIDHNEEEQTTIFAPGDDSIWEEERSTPERILSAIGTGMKGRKAIEEALGATTPLDKQKIKVALDRMVKRGSITLIGGQGGEYKKTSSYPQGIQEGIHAPVDKPRTEDSIPF